MDIIHFSPQNNIWISLTSETVLLEITNIFYSRFQRICIKMRAEMWNLNPQLVCALEKQREVFRSSLPLSFVHRS